MFLLDYFLSCWPQLKTFECQNGLLNNFNLIFGFLNFQSVTINDMVQTVYKLHFCFLLSINLSNSGTLHCWEYKVLKYICWVKVYFWFWKKIFTMYLNLFANLWCGNEKRMRNLESRKAKALSCFDPASNFSYLSTL